MLYIVIYTNNNIIIIIYSILHFDVGILFKLHKYEHTALKIGNLSLKNHV